MSLVSVNDNNAVVHIDHNRILQSLKLNPNDPKTQALLLICDRYGLDPILKHMVLVDSNPYVTRDGLLHVAHRSGKFDGIEVVEQGETSTHYTATVAVYRKDMTRPFKYPGRYKKGSRQAENYGPEMAIKCAEVMSLRRAFDVTGIAVLEEQTDQADAVYTDSATLPADDSAVNASTSRGRLATQEQLDEIKALSASLTPDEKKAMTAWKETSGIDWASVTFAQAEAAIDHLRDVLKDDDGATPTGAMPGDVGDELGKYDAPDGPVDAEVVYGPGEEPFT